MAGVVKRDAETASAEPTTPLMTTEAAIETTTVAAEVTSAAVAAEIATAEVIATSSEQPTTIAATEAPTSKALHAFHICSMVLHNSGGTRAVGSGAG